MIQEISLVLIAAALLVLVIIHVPALLQFRRTAREMEKFMEGARMQIAPLSHDLTVISQEIKGVLTSIRRQIESVEEGVDTFRDTARRLRSFEEELMQRIERPLLETATILSGVIHGFEVLKRLFRC